MLHSVIGWERTSSASRRQTRGKLVSIVISSYKEREVSMPKQAAKLAVQLNIDAHADAEELDQLTTSLRRQLLELDVEAVDRPRGEPPPPGARAVEAAALGELLVTLAPAVMGVVVETIRSWLSRSRGRSAKLKFGDNEIEITGASSEQQERLIAVFLARGIES
jgi:hypothetical protein